MRYKIVGIKFCPDLTSHEEVKAMFVGQGDFTKPILHACIKEKCIAYDYKRGHCNKYDNTVEIAEVCKDVE